MLKSLWFTKLGISSKDFFVVFILLFNTLTWLYMSIVMIDDIVSSLNLPPMVWMLYYVSIVASALMGSFLSKRTKLSQFLIGWMALGSIFSFLPFLLPSITLEFMAIFSVLLGASFGLGMPSSLAYFADHTFIENRGRIGGLILLSVNLGALPLAIPFITFDYRVNSLILAIWRGIGLIFLLVWRPKDKIQQERRRQASLISLFNNRAFMLYLVPWIMFSFVDRFGGEILGRELIEVIIGSFSAFAGGFLSDRIGRKRVVVYSFVMLGLAYGIMGIAPTLLVSKYIYVIFDGLAAGMLSLMFIFVLWGDLSPSDLREKYYVIGSAPLFLTYIAPLFLLPYVSVVPPAATFSLASFFLFLAVLPLIYAPETLPEKKIRLRQLQSYAERAKKAMEKYLKKPDAAS